MSIYNFTNLNGGGSYTGPTSTSGYNSTTLQGTVTISGGIQEWTVPTTGSYSIEAWGASGGDGYDPAPSGSAARYGGVGRYVKITTTLTQGTDIYILVGQGGRHMYTSCGSGGGGSFVTTAKGSGTTASQILVIAGYLKVSILIVISAKVILLFGNAVIYFILIILNAKKY